MLLAIISEQIAIGADVVESAAQVDNQTSSTGSRRPKHRKKPKGHAVASYDNIQPQQGSLNLAGLQLDSLAGLSAIGLRYPCVQELYLNNNILHNISFEMICLWRGLSVLILSSNNLRNLPSLAELNNLQELRCANNELTALGSAQLAQCPQLTTIDLERNRLTAIDENELPPALAHIFVAGNRLSKASKKALRKKLAHTARFALKKKLKRHPTPNEIATRIDCSSTGLELIRRSRRR